MKDQRSFSSSGSAFSLNGTERIQFLIRQRCVKCLIEHTRFCSCYAVNLLCFLSQQLSLLRCNGTSGPTLVDPLIAVVKILGQRTVLRLLLDASDPVAQLGAGVLGVGGVGQVAISDVVTFLQQKIPSTVLTPAD
jgi:hypothetical protein